MAPRAPSLGENWCTCSAPPFFSSTSCETTTDACRRGCGFALALLAGGGFGAVVAVAA
jgi:hypothetical protein